MTEGPNGGGSAGDRPGRKRWPWIALGVVALLLLGGYAALVALFPPSKLRALVVPRLQAAVGRDVKLSSVHLKLFPRVAIRLDDLSIANAPGFGAEPAIQLKALDLEPRLLPLLRGEVELRSLRLIQPVIRYAVDSAGHSNFEGLGPSGSAVAASAGGAAANTAGTQGGPPPGGASSAALLVIADLTLQEGTLSYTDARSGRWLRVGDLEGRLTSSRPEGRARALASGGRIDFGRLRIGLPAAGADSIVLPDARVDYDLLVDLAGDSLSLRTLGLRLGDLVLNGEGSAHGLSGARSYRLALRSGDVDIGKLLSALPEGLRPSMTPSGRGRFDLKVNSPEAGSRRPALNGTLALQDLAVERKGANLVTEGTGSLAFSMDSVVIQSFRGRLLGRPLQLSGRVTNFRSPQVRGRVTAEADVAELARLWSGAPAASGLVSLDLQISGPVKRPSELGIAGPVRLSNVRYPRSAPGAPILIPAAMLRFGATTVTTDSLPIEIGKSDLTLSFTGRRILPLAFGKPAPGATLEFRAVSRHFDWTEVMPDTTLGYADLLTARLAGRKIGGQEPGALARERYRPPPLPPVDASGQVRIAEFVNPPTTARNVTFQVVLKNGRLEVRNVTGKVYGGDLKGGLSVELGQGRAPFPVHYDFKLQGAQAAPFVRRWTRLGAAVTGALNFTVQGNTSLDETLLPVTGATAARGRADFRDGRFQDFGLTRRLASELKMAPDFATSFQRFGGPYRIEGGAFQLERWQLVAPDLKAAVTGSAGLGGALNLKVDLTVPAATIRESGLLRGAGLGQLANALLGRRDSLQLAVGLGGTLSDPVVQLDMNALQKQLRGGAEDLLKGLFKKPRTDSLSSFESRMK